jgi:hypothetical protein
MLDDKEAVLQIIKARLNPNHTAKKMRGEVFTPLEIVNKLLDELPFHIWANPSFKWLDPANGIGNFPIAVFYWLMVGLSRVIPDFEKRKRHILEEMLYVCEIDQTNTEVYKDLCGRGYSLNLVEGDFLQHEFGNLKFQVIMGNPPYNTPGLKSNGNVLYPRFVNKSLQLLKENGFLCMVTPPGWRKPITSRSPYSGMFEALTRDCQMRFLEMHTAQDGLKHMSAGTRFDLYVIQNKPCRTKTSVFDIDGAEWHLDLREWPWLPNCAFPLIKTMLSTTPDQIKVLRGVHVKECSLVPSDEFPHPVIQGIDTRGTRMSYSAGSHNKNVPKVIIGHSGTGFLADTHGHYSLGSGVFGLPITSQRDSEPLIQFLKSPTFKELRRACAWSTFRLDWRLFTHLRDRFWLLQES